MSQKLINWCLFILLCLIWGSSFILMKESKAGLTPLQIGGLRIFSAGLVFIPFALFHFTKIPRRKIGWVIITGIFGNLIPAFLFPLAMARIDSSLTGILNSLTPLCVVLIGILLFKARIHTSKIIGVLIGFVGLVLLTWTRTDIRLDNIGYASLVLLATVSYGLNVNIVGHYLKGVQPIHVASVSLAFMTIPSGLILWQQNFQDLNFSLATVQWSLLNTILLGIVSSAIATVMFYALVQKAGGLFASLVTYGVPFVAIFWGVLDGEQITWITVACLLLILFGVFLANRPVRKEAPVLASSDL